MYYFAHAYMMDGWDYGHGSGGWSWLFMFFVLAFLIVGIALAVRLVSSDSSRPTDDALNILKNRYAKGEITKKQFDEMKKDIK